MEDRKEARHSPPWEAHDVMRHDCHDIGKVGLPDRLQAKPFSELTKEERALVMRHPASARRPMALEQLAGAASLIRCHHHELTMAAVPDGCSALDFRSAPRVLTVANEYHAPRAEARTACAWALVEPSTTWHERRGKRYDPAIVDALSTLLGGESPTSTTSSSPVPVPPVAARNDRGARSHDPRRHHAPCKGLCSRRGAHHETAAIRALRRSSADRVRPSGASRRRRIPSPPRISLDRGDRAVAFH